MYLELSSRAVLFCIFLSTFVFILNLVTSILHFFRRRFLCGCIHSLKPLQTFLCLWCQGSDILPLIFVASWADANILMYLTYKTRSLSCKFLPVAWDGLEMVCSWFCSIESLLFFCSVSCWYLTAAQRKLNTSLTFELDLFRPTHLICTTIYDTNRWLCIMNHTAATSPHSPRLPTTGIYGTESIST